MEAVVREKDSSGHAVIHCHATLEDVGDCTILQDSYAVNMRTLKAQTGMHLDASGSINLGTYVSAAVGSENVLGAARSTGINIFTDDGGASYSGVDVRAGRARFLITTSKSGQNNYMSGFLGHLKYAAGTDTCTASFRAGLRGYLESVSGATIGDMSAGVVGLVDAPSGATIGTGYVSCFLGSSFNLGGSKSGKAVILDVRRPQTAGTFDALMHIDSLSGVVNTTSTGNQDTSKWLIVYFNDTAMKIPLYAIS
ncbi:MAG TPA: hypothetical protein VKF42_09855 [Chitinivibrionales bacterium]|nr:hypothetical protein [Chitinivibrionales bacterium]